MWNDSQSGVAWLKAPSMRGLSALPERRCSSCSASSTAPVIGRQWDR